MFLVNFVVEVDIFTKNPKFQSVSNFCRNQGWLSNVYVWLIWAETWPIRLKLSMISELWLVKTPQICLLFLKSSQFQIKIACALKIVKCIFLRNLFRGENIDVLRTHMLTSHKRGKKGNMSVSWVTILCNISVKRACQIVTSVFKKTGRSPSKNVVVLKTWSINCKSTRPPLFFLPS